METVFLKNPLLLIFLSIVGICFCVLLNQYMSKEE
ncbi:unnamed protein product [Larinioides sclopetarius]|uniref:Uncharacterized protein n=1 Tax=Larinioides sclopetarius TaxID=280406 RepID=A0AAV1ZXE1_9ARAC